MKLSKDKIIQILSYYPLLLQCKIYKQSKRYQTINNINIEYYKLIHFLQNYLVEQYDMSLYYNCLIQNFPLVPKNTIKEILLHFLNEYSNNNNIVISNTNSFSLDILDNIEKGIVLQICSIKKNIIQLKNYYPNIKIIDLTQCNYDEDFIAFLKQKYIIPNAVNAIYYLAETDHCNDIYKYTLPEEITKAK